MTSHIYTIILSVPFFLSPTAKWLPSQQLNEAKTVQGQEARAMCLQGILNSIRLCISKPDSSLFPQPTLVALVRQKPSARQGLFDLLSVHFRGFFLKSCDQSYDTNTTDDATPL